MEHLRVIHKKDGKYYVQRRFRFLFWKYWLDLDAYGDCCNGWYPKVPMTFDDEKYAIDAMDRCMENESDKTDNNHNDYTVIMEISY